MKKEYLFSDKIMGCDLNVAIVAKSRLEAEKAYKKVLELGKQYDQTYSRFIPESELSKLNKKKGLVVSKEFIEIILQAKKLYRETDHYFNPLVQIGRYGYGKTFSITKDNPSKIIDAPYNIDFEEVEIDVDQSKITLSSDQMIDLGGFLKGYVAEKMSGLLEKFSGSIVNLGGDIYTCGLDENDEPFLFDITNPVTGKTAKNVTVVNGALATSGSYSRSWKNGKNTFHHILDKDGRTNPKTDIVSATVIEKNGGRAEAMTKFAIALGSTKAKKRLEQLGINFVLIDNAGKVTTN